MTGTSLVTCLFRSAETSGESESFSAVQACIALPEQIPHRPPWTKIVKCNRDGLNRCPSNSKIKQSLKRVPECNVTSPATSDSAVTGDVLLDCISQPVIMQGLHLSSSVHGLPSIWTAFHLVMTGSNYK